MDIGLFSESGNRTNPLPGDGFEQDLDEIVLADALGYSEVWIAEPNHVRPVTVTNAHMLMCKASGLTQNIRFCSGIRQLPMHHPIDVVQEANMCDQITRGRYTFGYGGTHLVSKEQMEMRGYADTSDEATRAMVHESIDLILRCWTEPQPFEYAGRFWQGKQVHVLPEPYQKPHPPIGAGCSGSADTLELAARHGFFPIFGRPPATAQEIRAWGDHYLRAAEAAGQPAQRKPFRVAHMAYVAETDAEALADMREPLTQRLRNAPSEYHKKWIPAGGSEEDLTFDYMCQVGYFWIGSPETVYRQVMEYYEESGGFGVLLLMAGNPLGTHEQALRSLRLFGDEVAPRLKDLDPDRVAVAQGA